MGIPAFVSEIIETGLWLKSGAQYSFYDISESLKQNEFRIERDVDSAEVFSFVSGLNQQNNPRTKPNYHISFIIIIIIHITMIE
jgi:hypothetical protein